MDRHAPRSGHAPEHEAGTQRTGRTGDPIGGRPASRPAGFTWQVGPVGEVFMPFAALVIGRRGYAPDAMNRAHKALTEFDVIARQRQLGVAAAGVPTLPEGATLVRAVTDTQVLDDVLTENPSRS